MQHKDFLNFRTDIQALRGLAVLLVVFYHAKLGIFKAGYLGVDIFFVISGYLITGMVKNRIEQNRFSFADFYFRRAKRLLPAAYVVLILTAIFSVPLLTAGELNDFFKQVAGAVTFTGNMVLWRQAGYFDTSSALKPLLHIWSLSIEEQYYLVLPVALALTPRRFWTTGITSVFFSSLLLCVWISAIKPAAAFYWLPTRAWEIALGSLAAMITMGGVKKIELYLSLFFWPSLIALIVLPIAPTGLVHPGLDALLVCSATAVIILRRHSRLNAHLGVQALARVGDFSYSLYLVHWPIFALINNIYVTDPTPTAHFLALALSLSLAFLLYRFVELPIRRAEIQFSKKVVLSTIAISLTLAIAPIFRIFTHTPTPDYAHIKRTNVGFGIACEFGSQFIPKPECRNSDAPSIVVWGDSFAMHLIPGIIDSTSDGVMQATKSVCAPFADIAPTDNNIYTRSWAADCLAFNQSVLDYLTQNPSIKLVILSSPFTPYLGASSELNPSWQLLKKSDAGGYIILESNESNAMDSMRKTIKMLKQMGKRVLLIAPLPASNFDIGRCLERKATGKLTLDVKNNCNIPVSDYHREKKPVLNFLKQIQNELDNPVVYFDPALCSNGFCATSLDATFIYRDSGHFSYDGSKLLAKKIHMENILQSATK